jgi:hypothetical protein
LRASWRFSWVLFQTATHPSRWNEGRAPATWL